jgi:hypothetical protein
MDNIKTIIKTIVETLPYLLLVAYLIWSIIYVRKAAKHPDNVNKYTFDLIPQIFTTIGILGTFLGIAVGLFFFDPNKIQESIPILLAGLRTAFIASIFGIILYFIFSKWTAHVQNKNEEGKLSNEAIALNKIIDLVTEMKNNFNDSFIFTDDNNNKVKPANFFRDIYQESRKQSIALQSFSTDLSMKIEAGFEKILNNPDKGVTFELHQLKDEIEKLGKNLQDPTTEMTQNVVKDLQAAMSNMVAEFKASVSGSAKSELEGLATLLSKAGGSLTDFPVKLQAMTDNLNTNFKGLQEVVQQIARQTLSQSEQSTEEMRRQVEEMSEILKIKVGDLQVGQEVLMTKQSENLQVSDKLLNAFNTSIDKMNALSIEVTDTIVGFSKMQSELNASAVQLRQTAENANTSSASFKEGQLEFARHSTEFVKHNLEIITKIESSLLRAQIVSKEYAEKFSIIEKGLQAIFGRIQSGLTDYNNIVGIGLESYLTKYTEALTKTAESLAGASSKQEDILEELTEQLGKLNVRN